MTSQRPEFNYQHPVYLRARDKAFARSDDDCQLCGQQPAAEAHHWAVDYPPADETTANDLTALCAECHFIATTLRRFTRAGGSRHQFRALLSEAITQCDLNSPFPASPPSSCTTEYPCKGPGILCGGLRESDSHRHRGREPPCERCRRDDGTARRSTASQAPAPTTVRPAAIDLLTAPRVVTLGQIPVVVVRSATALRARPQTDVHFAWSSAA